MAFLKLSDGQQHRITVACVGPEMTGFEGKPQHRIYLHREPGVTGGDDYVCNVYQGSPVLVRQLQSKHLPCAGATYLIKLGKKDGKSAWEVEFLHHSSALEMSLESAQAKRIPASTNGNGNGKGNYMKPAFPKIIPVATIDRAITLYEQVRVRVNQTHERYAKEAGAILAITMLVAQITADGYEESSDRQILEADELVEVDY